MVEEQRTKKAFQRERESESVCVNNQYSDVCIHLVESERALRGSLFHIQ